ncbi:hypothetical protein ABW19_dt0207035 [Dactylella cylindrospora]|nr:hypothetical protein ABW19_dt0207035 [Dactylella cylindrospora]
MDSEYASTSKYPKLCDLPVEILHLILDDVVRSTRFYLALELRLVSKIFDQIIVDSLLLFSDEVKYLPKLFGATALHRRLCSGKSKHLEVVQYIQFLTDKVCEIDDWRDRDEVYLYLARAAITHLGPSQVFRPERIISEEYDYTSEDGTVIESGAEVLRRQDYINHARALAFMMSSSRYQELEKVVWPRKDNIANLYTPYFGKLARVSLKLGHLPEEQCSYILKCNKHWQTPNEPSSRRLVFRVLNKAAYYGFSNIVKEIVGRFSLHTALCYKGEKINPLSCDLKDIIISAAVSGDIETIRVFLQVANDFNPLLAAYLASQGRHEALRYVLENCPYIDFDNPWPIGDFRPLIACAATSGNKIMVKWLLVTHQSPEESLLEAMWCTLTHGYHDIFTLLLEYLYNGKYFQVEKGSIEHQYKKVWTTLGACGREKTIRQFLSKRPYMDTIHAVLILKAAAIRGDREIMKLLLGEGILDAIPEDVTNSLVPTSTFVDHGSTYLEFREIMLSSGVLPSRTVDSFPEPGTEYKPKVFLIRALKADKTRLYSKVYTPPNLPTSR